MPGCSVPNCHRRADKGYRMFVFPKRPDKRKLWARLCKREDKPPKHARICEYHFDDNQFTIDFRGKRGKLKPNAIPTVYDAPLSARNVTNGILDDIQPEFVDVSQQDDDSLWRNDFNVDSLCVEENFDIERKGSECGENVQYSSVEVEELCIEPEIVEGSLKSIMKNEDTLISENNNVQNIIEKTKDLEEQLRNKDKELVKTQRLLSKSLKQVETLQALNEKFQAQISKLSGRSHSKSYPSRRERRKPAKFLN
ncbi:uncharacterized protein LOC117174312 isoform X2 [Belonocnema kinseyi]|nr:uncharacterized protein LOC117174312 isoform X2 [Belonocnema kinseyi]XP_033219204.1 uncharacterized protein LOC117174312 isoform X2 [Belonocnema kinseyi]